MEEKKTFVDYVGQTMSLFGITVVMMSALAILFGEEAQGLSSMFQFGAEGLAISTMAQFFVITVVTTFLRFLFFTEGIIKRGSGLFRTIGMLLGIIAVIVIFVLVFGWFPAEMWQAWIAFAICFAVCFSSSLLIMLWKTNQENKKMEEGLARYRAGKKNAKKDNDN